VKQPKLFITWCEDGHEYSGIQDGDLSEPSPCICVNFFKYSILSDVRYLFIIWIIITMLLGSKACISAEDKLYMAKRGLINHLETWEGILIIYLGRYMSLDTYADLGLNHGKRISLFSTFLVLSVLFSLSSLTLGEKIEYCYNPPLNDSGDWSENIVAQKFDPKLGDLHGAQIIANLTLLYDVQASNDRNLSANVTFDCVGNLSLALPDKSVLYTESAIIVLN
jgi:hypothetical protein